MKRAAHWIAAFFALTSCVRHVGDPVETIQRGEPTLTSETEPIGPKSIVTTRWEGNDLVLHVERQPMCITHSVQTTKVTSVVARRRSETYWSGFWMATGGIAALLGVVAIGASFGSPSEDNMHPEDARAPGIGLVLGGLAVFVPLAFHTSGKDRTSSPRAPEIESTDHPAAACGELAPDTGRRVDLFLRRDGVFAQRRSVVVDEHGAAHVDFSGTGSVEDACRGLGIVIRAAGEADGPELTVDHAWFAARASPTSAAGRSTLQDLATGCCAAPRQVKYSGVCRSRCLADTRTEACFAADTGCRVAAKREEEPSKATAICRDLFDQCLETRETSRKAIESCVATCEVKMARYECRAEGMPK